MFTTLDTPDGVWMLYSESTARDPGIVGQPLAFGRLLFVTLLLSCLILRLNAPRFYSVFNTNSFSFFHQLPVELRCLEILRRMMYRP